MELKVTKEFVREAHGAACSTWKQRIEKEFPELFEIKFEAGKWYKTFGGSLFFLTHFDGRKNKGYGFNSCKSYSDVRGGYGFFGYKENIISEATPAEIEAVIIAEAKKRGYKLGVKTQHGVITDGWDEWEWDGFRLYHHNILVFKSGEWTDILPEEKTIITKEKALKILAKKLKVSPESIEIK